MVDKRSPVRRVQIEHCAHGGSNFWRGGWLSQQRQTAADPAAPLEGVSSAESSGLARGA